MQVADLYIRVSTDEQVTGYSLGYQEEVLRRHCALNNIVIRQVIQEDYSAKTFRRPAWKNYLISLRNNNGKANLLLFTKWDRFSRNAADAYNMIRILKERGIQTQAIEQPLDFAIPETKIMLAIYVSTPEVENDRRALNVKGGMRKARKEGRFMGAAPVGYLNKSDEKGNKYICIDPDQGEIVKWAFEQVADGLFNVEQILGMAKQKGLRVNKAYFWKVIKNPTYCGKIIVPAYLDEAEFLVDGQHDALISESLFYKAQDVLNGRSRKHRPRIVSHLMFHLRGFLLCPACGKTLTASSSRGYSQQYHYYHCTRGCSYRIASKQMHEDFEKLIESFSFPARKASLYKDIVYKEWSSKSEPDREEYRKLSAEIKDAEKKLATARDLFASGDITGDDFRAMKARYSREIEIAEAHLKECKKDESDVRELIKTATLNVIKLSAAYKNAGADFKRQIVSSIFPEKLCLQGRLVRTARVNEVVSLFVTLDGHLQKKNSGQEQKFDSLSAKEVRSGFEPLYELLQSSA